MSDQISTFGVQDIATTLTKITTAEINRTEAIGYLFDKVNYICSHGANRGTDDGNLGYLQIHAIREGEKFTPRTAIAITRNSLDAVVKAVDWGAEYSKQGYSIYVTLNAHDNPNRRGKEYVISYCFVAGDCDVYKIAERTVTQSDAMGELVGFEIEPGKIINSGRGIQPIYPTFAKDYEEWQPLAEGIYRKTKHLAGDESFRTDSARLYKVPGFPAYKGGQVYQTGVMFESGETLKGIPPSVLKTAFSYTVTETGKSSPNATRAGNWIVVSEPRYELSPLAKWLASSKVLYQGNPIGENHVEGLSGRNDTAWKLASRCAEPDRSTGMPYSEALYVYGLVVEHHMFPPMGDADDDSETWEQMLTRAYKQYRGADHSTWEYRGRGSEHDEQEQEPVSDDNCSDGILLDDFLNQRGKRRDCLLFELERFMPSVLYGPSGVGKTTATLEMLFHAIANKQFHGWTVDRSGKPPLRVLYVEKEDSVDATRRKLQKMLGGTYNIAEEGEPDEFVTYMGNYDEYEREVIRKNFVLLADPIINDDPAMLSDPRHIKWLIGQARKHWADLVVIDTYKASFAVDENNNDEVSQKVIEPMKAVMREAGCAVILLHHTGTDDGRMRGATSLEGAARWVVKITPVREPDPMNPAKTRRVHNHFRLECQKTKGDKLPDVFLRINNEGDALKVDEPNHPVAMAFASGDTFHSATASPECQRSRKTPEMWQDAIKIALLERERTQPGEWVTAPRLAKDMDGRPKAIRDALNALSAGADDLVERREMAHAGEFEYRVRPVPQED